MSKNQVRDLFFPSMTFPVFKNILSYCVSQGPSAYAIWYAQREPQLAAELFARDRFPPTSQELAVELLREWTAMTDAQKGQYRTELDAQFAEISTERAAFHYFRKARLGEYQSIRDDLIRRHGLDDDSVDKSIALEWRNLTGPAEQRSWIQHGVGKTRRDEYRSMRDEMVRRAGLREDFVESSIAIEWGKMGPAEKRPWMQGPVGRLERGGNILQTQSNGSQEHSELSRSVL